MSATRRCGSPARSAGRPAGRPPGSPHREGSDGVEQARQRRSDPGRSKPRLVSVSGLSVPVRPRVSDALVMKVASHLTDRDHEILNMLEVHRVFTTDQLCDLFFTNLTTARHRLTTLYQLRLVDRFEPFRSKGSAPYHYVLDQLGAMVVAANRDVDVKQLGWKRDKILALARSQRLAHTVGVNGFFTALAREARCRPRAALIEWWSEARCATWAKPLVRPDGYGACAEDGKAVEFFFEYDRHTEPLTRVAAKLDGYASLMTAVGRTIPVLFCFGSGRREGNAWRALADPPVPAATAALGPSQAPLDAVWRPVGATSPGPCRLVELADVRWRPLPPSVSWPAGAYPAWWYREGAPAPATGVRSEDRFSAR